MGDVAGKLHFVRVNGTLLFSQQIFDRSRVPAGHNVSLRAAAAAAARR